jgi:hypothetical protein
MRVGSSAAEPGRHVVPRPIADMKRLRSIGGRLLVRSVGYEAMADRRTTPSRPDSDSTAF